MTTIDDIKEMATALETKMRTEGRQILTGVFTEWFDKNPGVKALSWAQYTPYFNDGDECVFRVHGLYFSTVEVDPAEVDRPGYDEGPWAYPSQREAASAPIRALDDTLNSVEALLKATFGDHVYVIATRAGFHVGDCEHD